MRHTLPGIGAEVAAAIRQVNAAYYSIPESYRPAAAEWDGIDRQLDAACAAGDRDRALGAIEDWRDHYLTMFAARLTSCRLEEVERG